MKYTVLLLVAILLLDVASGDGETAPPRVTVAYVYGKYATAFTNVRTFLTNNGYVFMPVAVTNDEADLADYSACRAILIDWNCGTNVSGSMAMYWAGSDAARERIRTAGCFVLGFRDGGSAFCAPLERRGINMWFSATATDMPRTYLHAADVSHAVWNTPHELAFSASNRCEIYSEAQSVRVPYLGYMPVESTIIARATPSYADIAVTLTNGTPIGFWGFAGDPYAMNENGRNLLLNLIEHYGRE
jgi:hypothetical protein